MLTSKPAGQDAWKKMFVRVDEKSVSLQRLVRTWTFNVVRRRLMMMRKRRFGFDSFRRRVDTLFDDGRCCGVG